MKKGLFALAVCCAATTATANIDVKHYGFIKAGLTSADKGVNSFGDQTFKAPTSAINETAASDADKQSHMLLQSAQTRWGMILTNGEGVTGKLELDAAGSTGLAETAVKIRVRQANVNYKNGNGTLFAGQKWVTFSGLNPHTYNFVAAGFTAGNSGFIGNEFGYAHTFGGLKVTAALGNKGKNTATTHNQTSIGTPLMTLRLDYNMDVHHIGFVTATGKLEYSKANAAHKDSDIMGMKLFYNGKFMDKLDVKFEYFTGSNLNSAGFLTLASAKDADDKKYDEKGYYLSAKYMASETMSFILGYGSDEIDKKSDFNTGDLVKNSQVRLGAGFKQSKNLDLFLVHESFTSGYLNASNEVKDSTAGVTELGLLYKF